MTIDPRIAAVAAEAAHWRHDFHAHPELLYDLDRTSAAVAGLLAGFGVDRIERGIGRTGVVALLHGRGGPSDAIVGLRADMDALPLTETASAAHASTIPGRMHACGHDGHTAMLLGAARHLAATRDFDGTVAFVFQPAEEGGAGAKAMIDDGLFERFPIREIYGLHNMPGLEVGRFAARSGAVMASTDRIDIEIEGVGGHAARPHTCVDPVMIGAQVVTALQTIVARTLDPLDAAVVSITQFEAGSAFNVIPHKAVLAGTARALSASVRDHLEERIRDIVEGIARSHGGRAQVVYTRGYPVTRNHPAETAFAADVAASIVGHDAVDRDLAPMMGAEDFAYMLEARPGAFLFIGNGASAGLHHPEYDFDDAALPFGIAYWTELARAATARA